jgi:apolipoprotein D and lipocalin family protein
MNILKISSLFLFISCSSVNFTQTVSKVDLNQFMGKWYVMAGRFTFLEKDVHNGVETYTWNEKEQRIDIGFTFNQGSFTGKAKSIPQKGWVYNQKTNAHWKVSPFWPLKFDYLVIDLASDYSWTAIGVPNGKYLWIMARDRHLEHKVLQQIITRLNNMGYPTQDIVLVPHQ